jgi:hypothetical protein
MNDNKDDRLHEYMAGLTEAVESAMSEYMQQFTVDNFASTKDGMMQAEQFISLLGRNTVVLCLATIRSMMVTSVFNDNPDLPYEILDNFEKDLKEHMKGYEQFKAELVEQAAKSFTVPPEQLN